MGMFRKSGYDHDILRALVMLNISFILSYVVLR